ncbi:hypothetical protein M422DRAFT_155228 [Sphaerobolus stellatus SS14]|nr:hypothetical protein M422DRAFT_155228 [Sphaerobolus stellatus SS14]
MSSRTSDQEPIISPSIPNFKEDNDRDALSNEVTEPLLPVSSRDNTSQLTRVVRESGRPEAFQEQVSRFLTQNTGLFLICLSQLSSSCMGASVQMLNKRERPFPPTQILVFRQVVSMTVLSRRYHGVNHPLLGPPEVRYLLVLRGTAGFCGVFGTYYALQYLSLPDATVIAFLSPFFTSFGSTFFLREPFSRRNFFAGILSLAGVILIARPKALFGQSSVVNESNPDDLADKTTAEQRLMAVGVALLGAIGISTAYISLRAIGKRAHPLHCMNYFALFSGMISILIIVFTGADVVIPTDWNAVLLLIAVTVFGFGAQILLVWGLRKETASRGSLAIYTQVIVFAYILERLLFHATPSLLSLIGTLIILGSGLFVAVGPHFKIPKFSGRN